MKKDTVFLGISAKITLDSPLFKSQSLVKKLQKRQGLVWESLTALKDCVGEQTLRQLGVCALWCDVALRMRKEKRTREQGSSTLPAGLLGNILNSSM